MSARNRRRGWILAATAASAVGFFFGIGQAIVPVTAATLLAGLPVLLLAPRVGGAAAAGAAFAAALLGGTNSWAFYTRSHDVPLPLGVLISISFALSFAGAVAVFRLLLVRDRPVWAVLAGPATWGAALFAIPLLEPYGLVGTFGEHLGIPVALQVASVTGRLGVDVVLFVAWCTVAAATVAGVRWRALTAGVVVVGLALGFGALRLAAAPDGGPTQRVALVVSTPTVWGPEVSTPAGRALLDAYVAQVAALPPGVDLAVLPEGALTVDTTTLPQVEAAFAAVARARGTTVVLGMTRNADGQKYANALVVPASGAPPQLYLKHHDRVSPQGQQLTFVPGTPTRTGVMICADSDFPDVARDYGAAGAGLVVSPASDNVDNGWLHSREGALRGVENGFAMVWPGQQGELMVADRYGHVLVSTPVTGPQPFTTAVVDVPVAPSATVHAAIGEVFGWLCAGLVLLALVRARRPRAAQPASDPAGDALPGEPVSVARSVR